MARLSFRCDEELVRRVDAARGRVARERWLRDAVDKATLPTDDDAPPIVQRVREHWDEEGYDPTAEPLVAGGPLREGDGVTLDERGRVVRSSQSKRDVRPIPKGNR